MNQFLSEASLGPDNRQSDVQIWPGWKQKVRKSKVVVACSLPPKNAQKPFLSFVWVFPFSLGPPIEEKQDFISAKKVASNINSSEV